MELAIKTENK